MLLHTTLFLERQPKSEADAVFGGCRQIEIVETMYVFYL